MSQTAQAPVVAPKVEILPKVTLDHAGELTLDAGVSVLPALRLVPQLEPFKAAVTELEAQAQRAVIDSVDKWQNGSEFLSFCAMNWDQLEALRKSVKKPIDDYAAFIQSLFVPLQNRFGAAKNSVAEKMLAFKKAEDARAAAAQELIRKANEEAALKLAEESQARGDTSGAHALLEVATMMPAPYPAPRLGGRNSMGKSTGTTKRWVGTVENPMVLLRAIIDGKVPISVLEWRPAELNKIAAALKVTATVNGIKMEQSETLGQR